MSKISKSEGGRFGSSKAADLDTKCCGTPILHPRSIEGLQRLLRSPQMKPTTALELLSNAVAQITKGKEDSWRSVKMLYFQYQQRLIESVQMLLLASYLAW